MFLFGLLCSLDPEVASVLGVFPQVKLQSSTKDAVMLHLLIHHVGCWVPIGVVTESEHAESEEISLASTT
jgi:hypothetical protein